MKNRHILLLFFLFIFLIKLIVFSSNASDDLIKNSAPEEKEKISSTPPNNEEKLPLEEPDNTEEENPVDKNSQNKLDSISISGNNWALDQMLRRRIKIKQSDVINEKKLKENIYFLNLNPFRKVDLILSPSKEKDFTNIELLVKDNFPFKLYAGSDNSGIKPTSRNRWYAGFRWNNFFGLDSILSYQFLSSFDVKDFYAHTAKWKIFLPWENILTFLGSYSSLRADLSLPTVIDNKGFNTQVSSRYEVLLPLLTNLSHSVIFGFDFKRTDTTLNFSEIEIVDDNAVNLTQFLLSYLLNYEKSIYKSKFVFKLFYSPGELISDQEDSRYNALRTFAENNYIYGKISLDNLFHLPKDYLFLLNFRAQVSNKNLLFSETLGIGGFDSVRGYFERALNADLGFIINTEFRTFPFHIMGKLKDKNNGFRFLAFFDYALSSLHKATALEDQTEHIFGFGPGLRYTLNPYITARLDWGFKGRKSNFGGGSSVLHFAVNISY